MAIIDPAAMPIRIEKWLVRGRVRYVVIGAAWGGSGHIRKLEIQLNTNEPYWPVELIHMPSSGPLALWKYIWVLKAQVCTEFACDCPTRTCVHVGSIRATTSEA